MIYEQNFLNCNIDSDLTSQANFAFQEVLEAKNAGKLPVLELPYKPEKVEALKRISDHFRQNFETVVVFGTGGSSLGGQSFVSLAQDAYGFQKMGPKLIFMDNIDPETFGRF